MASIDVASTLGTWIAAFLAMVAIFGVISPCCCGATFVVSELSLLMSSMIQNTSSYPPAFHYEMVPESSVDSGCQT
jgi:hypothetical protein